MATMRICDECEMPLETAEERKARLCHRCQFNRDGGEVLARLLTNLHGALERNWRTLPMGRDRMGRNG